MSLQLGGASEIVRIGECSPPARFYMHVCGLEGRPQLGLEAWDHIARNPSHQTEHPSKRQHFQQEPA